GKHAVGRYQREVDIREPSGRVDGDREAAVVARAQVDRDRRDDPLLADRVLARLRGGRRDAAVGAADRDLRCEPDDLRGLGPGVGHAGAWRTLRDHIEADKVASGRAARCECDREPHARHSVTSTWNSTTRGDPAVKWRATVSVGSDRLWKSER